MHPNEGASACHLHIILLLQTSLGILSVCFVSDCENHDIQKKNYYKNAKQNMNLHTNDEHGLSSLSE